MDCVFRVAEADEIDRILELRMDFISEFRPEYSPEQLDAIKRGSSDYFRE